MGRGFRAVTALVVGVCVGHYAIGGVVVVSGWIDVEARAVSGRLGSVDGPYVDDPPRMEGIAGTLHDTAHVTAGPVEAAVPPSPSLPGTTGWVEAGAVADVSLAPACHDLAISVDIGATNRFLAMDGGTYLGSGSAAFEVEFVIDHTTDYQLQGDVIWNPGDINGHLTLDGELAGTVERLTDLTAFTPFDRSGVLEPGRYFLSGLASVYQVPIPGVGEFHEFSSVTATLTLTPRQTRMVGDTDCNDCVNLSDLSTLLSNFGTATDATYGEGDSDGDGDVDLSDLSALLGGFGSGAGC